MSKVAPTRASTEKSSDSATRGTEQRRTRLARSDAWGGLLSLQHAAGNAAATTVLGRRGGPEETHDDAPLIVHDAVGEPGQPLDVGTRVSMEARLGYNFSHVRVHTGDVAGISARAIDAVAYTVGSDIVFAPTHYAPGTSRGQALRAHELAHVVQQQRA